MNGRPDAGDQDGNRDAAGGLPGEPAADAAGLPPEYLRAFSVIAFTMNRFIVDHLLRTARQFDNDTEAVVLFGTLSHLNVAHLVAPWSRPSTVLNADGRVPDATPQLRPVRIRDLAQITGRPRETIRRKLEGMIEAGRVRRVADGYVLDVAGVDAAMRARTVDAARRFMEASRLMAAALADAAAVLRADADGNPGPDSESGAV